MPTQAPAVDKTYIIDAIEELAELLPVKPPAPAADYYNLLRSKRVKECVEAMASYLNLPIRIHLIIVKPGDTSDNRFQSRDMVTTDSSGRGRDGITAQVLMPTSLPLYGSEEFRNMTFTVKVSEDCSASPEAFVTVMAHELSHVVLNSLWYADRANEVERHETTNQRSFSNT